MTSGRSHFRGEFLRSGRGHAQAGNVYDSWDDDYDESAVRSPSIAGHRVTTLPWSAGRPPLHFTSPNTLVIHCCLIRVRVTNYEVIIIQIRTLFGMNGLLYHPMKLHLKIHMPEYCNIDAMLALTTTCHYESYPNC